MCIFNGAEIPFGCGAKIFNYSSYATSHNCFNSATVLVDVIFALPFFANPPIMCVEVLSRVFNYLTQGCGVGGISLTPTPAI